MHLPTYISINCTMSVLDRNLAYQHAYTILNYDRVTDTVTYANPWNTALVYRMTLKDLSKYIDGIGCFDYMY